MCKTRNIVLEIIESPENKRTYVLREFSAPNQPPTTLYVADNAEEVAQFLDTIEVK